MVLEGELINEDDVVLQRITWTPTSDGSVQQLWEISEDGGETWDHRVRRHHRKIDRR